MSNVNDSNEPAPFLPPGQKMTLDEVVKKMLEKGLEESGADSDDGSKSLDGSQFDPTTLVTMDDKSIHKAATGRIYRRVAERDGSRLMMAANLEAIGTKAKTGGFWRTTAVVVRFIALDGDKFPELKSRDLSEQGNYDTKGAVYKDKIIYPFCIDAGPFYAALKFKERDVEKFIINDLSTRVPTAEVPAVISILDALVQDIPTDDPIKVEVLA